MALPTILVNSATGSDTAASGAGPGTALTGTAASTSGTGLVVTLDGSPDLSGVATDGSHVIYLADTTAGARNFGKITAADNSAKTVTVSDAFGLSLSGKSWAIGGKRASIGATTSKKLFDNNSAAGDAMPGWTIEMESGHTETITAAYVLRRAGDGTNGPITLCGTAGAATRPIVTFSNNNLAIQLAGSFQTVKDFELQNSNATKTASYALNPAISNGFGHCISGMVINHATNKFWKGILVSNSSAVVLRDCTIGNCASHGVDLAATSNGRWYIWNCAIQSCGGSGISGYDIGSSCEIFDCLITGNSGDGINSGITVNPLTIVNCTINANGGDGIELSGALSNSGGGPRIQICNNVLSNNGGYGLKCSNAASTSANLNGYAVTVEANNCYNNTSGAYLPTSYGTNDPALDPTFTNTGGNDYSIGTNLKAKGWPIGGSKTIGLTSSTYSYVDIGAAQRQEAGSGGATVIY